jgi:DNA-damage-inducible protein D
MKILPIEFDGQSIRRVYDEAADIWWLSVVDLVQVLTQQVDDLTARRYWNQLKRRLSKEGSELVTDCHQLKMAAAYCKQRLTDVATAETLLRLVLSVPSPKAEPIKLWPPRASRSTVPARPGSSMVAATSGLHSA